MTSVYIRKAEKHRLNKLTRSQSTFYKRFIEFIEKLKDVKTPEEKKKILMLYDCHNISQAKYKGINKDFRSVVLTGPGRLIFNFGNEVKKSDKYNPDKNDIYIHALLENHEYDELIDKTYTADKYVLFSKAKTTESRFDVYELTKKQKKYVNKFDFAPSLVVGSAGSGKTTLSIALYDAIYRYIFECKKIDYFDLCYATFNRKLLPVVNNQLENSYEVPHPYCYTYTIDDLLLRVLIDNNIPHPDKIASMEDFYEYVEENYLKSRNANKNRYAKVINKTKDYLNVLYTFYRGVYKGSMLKWQRKDFEKNLTRSEFIAGIVSSSRKDRYFKDYQKDAFYDVCESYAQYLKNNELFDDCDLAMSVIKAANEGKIKQLLHYVIIDEVQDLTEVQLYALLKIVNDEYAIHFFGDTYQAINPTVFSISKIDEAIRYASGETLKKRIEPDTFNETFRCEPQLLDFLNYLIELRKTYIGTEGHDAKLIPFEQNEKSPYWAKKTNDEDLIQLLINEAPNSPDTAIIVNNNQQKNELSEALKVKGGNKEIIYTIFEAKGMEFKTVILYDFISYFKDSYEEIFNADADAKNSLIHRFLFNRLYVACTRASEHFIICESKKIDSIYHLIFNHKDSNSLLFTQIEDIKDYDEVKNFFTVEDDYLAWYVRGKELLSANSFDKATKFLARALDMCNDDEDINKIKNYHAIANYLNEYSKKKVKPSVDYAKKILKEPELDTHMALNIFNDLHLNDGIIYAEAMLKRRSLSSDDMETLLNSKTFDKDEIFALLNTEEAITSLVNNIKAIKKEIYRIIRRK